MLRSSRDQQIPPDNRCVNAPAPRSSPKRNLFAANSPTFSQYLAPFRSQTDPLPDPPQPWNRTETSAMATSAKCIPEHSYGVLRSRAKVAKGIQTEGTSAANVATRKRCWRHRRSSADKSRRSSEHEQSRQEANSNLPSPNGNCKLALRSTLLPNVIFPRWARTSKQPPSKLSEDDIGVSSLVDSYLLPLYSPSVRRQLTSQAIARCRDSNREHFEAHWLGPTARLLRTVREHAKAHPNNNKKKKRGVKKPPGWPLCARGCLIVHISDPDPSALRAGDFYFVASPVGISLKWKTSREAIRERSFDAREFNSEMAALLGKANGTPVSKSSGCNFPSSDEGEGEDDDEERRTHLVVCDEGVGRVRVERLLEELLVEGRSGRRPRCTRDSWVQTDEGVEHRAQAPAVAPLASEEEFCSDTELKPKFLPEGVSKADPCAAARRSPLPQLQQPAAIAELDHRTMASQVTSMPGSRDVCGRSVVYITLRNMQDHTIEAIHLAEILLYFQTIPKKESMCLGFLVIVDGRGASSGTWNLLHKTLAIVEETVPGTISLVLVLHMKSHSSEYLSSKYPIHHIKFEAIVNENQLLKYISKDQLLPEFSGTFPYDHQEWIKLHEFVDPFVVGCHQMGCQIVQLIEDLRCDQSVPSQHLIEEQKRKIAGVLGDQRLIYLEEEGALFLRKIEEKRDTFRGNPDYAECVDKSRTLYKQLKKVVQRLSRLADKRLNKLQERIMMKAFEEESSQVLTWLNRKGEETLKKHKTLAETLNAIREQENEFEKFYFLAMRQIERGNDLLEEIPRVRESGLSTHLKRHLEDFTDRLEDARERLEDTARCYALLDKTYEWALETMRFVTHMRVDSSTPVSALVAIAKRLDSYLQTRPYIEDDVFEDMSRLADRLDNEALATQCQTARAKYEETVELIRARRDALAKAKERADYEESSNINESLDNLKIKPCLWNPLSQNVPYRTSSQTYLGSYNPNSGSQSHLKRESVGSYTAFPSSYYPSVGFRDRLLGRKSRREYFSKRGSLTEDLFLRLNRPEIEDGLSASENHSSPSRRPSYPFVNGTNDCKDDGSRSEASSEDRLQPSPSTGKLFEDGHSASENHSSPSRRPSYPFVNGTNNDDGSQSEASSEDRLQPSPSLSHRRTSLPFASDSNSKNVDSNTNSAYKFSMNGSESLQRGRKSYPFTSGNIVLDSNAKSVDLDKSELLGGKKSLSNDSMADLSTNELHQDLGIKPASVVSKQFSSDSMSDLKTSTILGLDADSGSGSLRGRKSYPFTSCDILRDLNGMDLNTISSDLASLQGRKSSINRDSKNASPDLDGMIASESKKTSGGLVSERNWKLCEADLKRFADEVREQNKALEEMRLSGQQDSVNLRHKPHLHGSRRYSHASNEEEAVHRRPAPVNSHLLRCASCSDFEELLSTKTTQPLNTPNNRTVKLIMMEMIQTERDYVKSLGYIIENYVPLLQNSGVSQSLRSQRNVIFGNIEKIYEFHNCYFLEELEQCESMPYSVGQYFLKYESQFYLYALYNKNKPKSDSLMAEYGNSFFKKKQLELGDKMDLASYLLKPVQRMGKYALLLKQLLKECPETNSEHYNNLKAAEEMVRFQLQHGNDLLAMDALRECDVNIKEQGRLLRQDEFLVWQGKRKALRHVFLFEDLVLFSKARRTGHYQYKSSIKTSDLGLTAQVGESPTKFEIWFRKCKAQDLYVLQAPSASVKSNWVDEVSNLLWKQAERNRNLRMEEMSSMGIGNKPCLDITPSRDQICDRSISLQQLNKVPRFRNSIAVSSNDNFDNNNGNGEPRRRPLSIISLMSSASSGEGQSSSTFYDTSRPLEEVEEPAANDKRRSMAQQSQCSAESGIFTELSTSGDSYAENVRRMKTVERCDSVISRTSYDSIEANEQKEIETSTSTSSPSGLAV